MLCQFQPINTVKFALIIFSNVNKCLTISPLCFQLDMQRGVHCRLMDNSTSVREAAVELLGRFVLSRPQLIEQYYDMLIERILVMSSSPECHVFKRKHIHIYTK